MATPSPNQHSGAPLSAAHRGGLFAGGVAGNERLTALAGIVLLVLLFFEGMTLLAIRPLLLPHAFIGFLLIPPLALKLASTGYRFIRYYTGDSRYRRAGPPVLFLRLLAPLLVLSVLVLIASGIILLLAGPHEGPWRQIHTLAFFFWFWIMTAHVLAYTPRALHLAWLDRARHGRDALAGAMTRQSLLIATLVLGIAIAAAQLPLDSSWAHALSQFRGDH